MGDPRRPSRDDELDEELESHLAMARRDAEERGLSPDQAERAARRELGNEILVKEVTREMWGGAWKERLSQDVRYGVRIMRRNPTFSAVAVLTLALGIGASAAVFSIVNAVLLRPLPFREPERLVCVWEARSPGDRNVVNGWNVLDWRERTKTLAGIAAIQELPAMSLGTGGGEVEPVRATLVTPEYFEVLGVPPALGRVFGPDDAVQLRERIVVLSHALWQRRFGGDPGIVGRPVTIDGRTSEVIGVMPEGFAFPKSEAELWGPMFITRADEGWSEGRSLTTVARLGPGVTLAQADADIKRIAAEVAALRPGSNKDWSAEVFPLLQDSTEGVRRPLLVILAGVFFLLVVACANVANLLVMRGTARQREVALRSALGAGRGRILVQFMTEALVLSVLAAALGLLFAYVAKTALVAILPASSQLPRATESHLDGRVLAFALGLAVTTTLLAGLAPALQAVRRNVQHALRNASARSGLAAGHRLRASFVVTQVALALVLLSGAGLVLRSFQKLVAVDPGFRTERVLSLSLWFPTSEVREPERRAAYLDRILDAVRTSPGVVSASSVHFLPLTDSTSASCFARGAEYPRVPADAPVSEMLVVSPGYFETLTTSLLAGRDLDARDVRGRPGAVVVNRAFADRFFPGEDPVGARLSLCWSVPNPVEIVGVVANARQRALRRAPAPTVFIPNAQSPMYFANLVVRSADDPRQIAGAVGAAIRKVNPQQAASGVRTLSEVFSRSVAEPRFQLVLLAVFALLALVLSSVGVYGVITCSVAERVPEIGIRMALGAGRAAVARLILREGLVLVGIGIAAGLCIAVGVTRVLESVLFEVQPTDPTTLGAVIALLLAVAAVATVLPARRAMGIEPMTALRSE
jgi:putative ABC transport system permease protein